MNYQEAREYLEGGRSKTERPLASNTRIRLVGGYVYIRLHNTDIIILWPNGDYILNSGGWETVTTQERINRFSPGAQVYSDGSGNWEVHTAIDSARFEDGMIIPADGSLQQHKKRVYEHWLYETARVRNREIERERNVIELNFRNEYECDECGFLNLGTVDEERDRFCLECEEYNQVHFPRPGGGYQPW